MQPTSIYRPKILIASDDQDVLDDAAALLGHLEFSLAIAHDASKAAQCLAGDPAIKVLIADPRMLKADGFRLLECLAELRDQQRSVRIAVVSSQVGLKFLQRAMQLGITDLLHGPLVLGEIGNPPSTLVAGEASLRKSTGPRGEVAPGQEVATIPAAGPDPVRAQHAGLRSAAVNERVLISRLVAMENIKRRCVGTDLFSDPCWNMILDLAVAERDERAVSTTSLCLASGAPMSTALRHLKRLVDRGYLIRHLDRKDKRRILVAFTDHARTRLTHLLRELARLEVPLAR